MMNQRSLGDEKKRTQNTLLLVMVIGSLLLFNAKIVGSLISVKLNLNLIGQKIQSY